MAVAAPRSSASLEPTKITPRIARPRRSQPFKTHDGPSAYSEDVTPARAIRRPRGLSMYPIPAIVNYVGFERVTIRRVGTLRNTVAGASR
jgi:hypothetical protein